LAIEYSTHRLRDVFEPFAKRATNRRQSSRSRPGFLFDGRMQPEPTFITKSSDSAIEPGQSVCSCRDSAGGPRQSAANAVKPKLSDAPEDATAKCKDGTYSHATQHRGACSGHGGVAEW